MLTSPENRLRVAIAVLPDRAERLNYHVRSGVLALVWQELMVSKSLINSREEKMLKSFIITIISLGILVNVSHAEYVWQREAVFEVMVDSLVLPPGQDSATLSELIYCSDSLRQALVR